MQLRLDNFLSRQNGAVSHLGAVIVPKEDCDETAAADLGTEGTALCLSLIVGMVACVSTCTKRKLFNQKKETKQYHSMLFQNIR